MNSGPVPVSERISENIVETLKGVSAAAGFNVDLDVERYDTRGNDPGHYKTIVSDGADAEADDADTPLGFKRWRRPYDIYVFVVESEASPVAYDTLANVARADVERALMADVTRGGWAQNTEVRDPILFSDQSDFGGVVVRIEVVYSHSETSPYETVPEE
jgi:hypothetical protein